MWKSERVLILVADDDPDDRMLIQEAFQELDTHCCLRFVEDGLELVDYLYRRNKYSDPMNSPRPDLILLDINMPRMNGYDALNLIRSNGFKDIPVIMLTTSDEEQVVLKSYMLGANAFVKKPLSFEELRMAAELITRFWLGLAALPPKPMANSTPGWHTAD